MQPVQFTAKHYASLSAIMLLAPIVPLVVKNSELALDQNDNAFLA
jgi:hypothetical protein